MFSAKRDFLKSFEAVGINWYLQGILAEVEGSVQLTSSLWCYKVKNIFNIKGADSNITVS